MTVRGSMELQFLRNEAVDTLVKGVPDTIDKYAHEKESWIEGFFAEQNIKMPVFSSEIEIDEMDLIHGDDASNDIKNAIILYENLKLKINPVQASDRRLWAALTHLSFYPYMCSRWPVENKLNEKGTNGTVTDRYLLSRGFFRNGIARLYWIPKLTHDSSLDDPYEYTRYLMGKQDLVNQVDGRSLCRNRTVLQACLKELKKAEPLTEAQRRQYFEKLCKKGGVRVLDALPQKHMESLCNETANEVMHIKYIGNGSIITVSSIETDMKMQFEIHDGKPYSGKTVFRSKPENLYRLTVGKEVRIGRHRYIIVDIK